MKKAKTFRPKYNGGMVEGRSIGARLGNILVTAIVICLAAICIIPMWHVLMCSLSDGQILTSYHGVALLPVGDFNIGGYLITLKNNLFISGYLNTIFYVVFTVGVGFVINIVGGYCIARNTRYSGIMSAYLMITMLFSGGMIAQFMVLNQLGLVGSRWSVVLVEATMAMNVLVAANAFRSVPQAVVEAAELDGCGHLRMMFQVMFPQAKSLIFVTILNSFVGAWNSWLTASIYVSGDRTKWPIQLVINTIVAENENFLNTVNPNYDRYLVQFAVIILAVLPILVAFPFFQDRIEAGVIAGGVKE